MDEKRLGELLSDQKFVDALGAADKAEEVIRIFAEYDMEVTKEDAAALLIARDEAPDGELSEDALDGVAGGMTLKQWIREVLKRIPHGSVHPWPRYPRR